MSLSYQSLSTPRHVSICIISFLATSLAVFPFLSTSVLETRLSPTGVTLIWVLVSLTCGLITSAIVSIGLRMPQRKWIGFLIPAFLLIIAHIRSFDVLNIRTLAQYGDSLAFFLTDDEDLGRWLLGYAAIREAFEAINAFVFSISAISFVRLSGGIVMAIWSSWIVLRVQSPVARWLLLLSPIWVLFSVGYDEYYPFVAGLLLAVSWQVLSGQQLFDQQTNYVLVGLMPALYIGAAPTSLALLLFTFGMEPHRYQRTKGLFISLFSFAIAVEVGGEFKGYFSNLESWMNLGGTVRSSEGGLEDSLLASTSSSRSFLASTSYALSSIHLVDIWFWLLCGTGLIVLLICLFVTQAPNKVQNKSFSPKRNLHISWNRIARLALIASAAVFLVFMLPDRKSVV